MIAIASLLLLRSPASAGLAEPAIYGARPASRSPSRRPIADDVAWLAPLVGGGGGPISILQSAIGLGSAANTVSVSFASTPAVGHAVLVTFTGWHQDQAGESCSDNQGNTYTLVKGAGDAAIGSASAYLAPITTASGTFTVTVTASSSHCTIAIMELNQPVSVDGTPGSGVSTTGTATSAAISAGTASGSTDMMFMVLNFFNDETASSWTSPLVLVKENGVTGGASCVFALGAGNHSTAGAKTATAGFPASSYVAIAGLLKGLGGGFAPAPWYWDFLPQILKAPLSSPRALAFESLPLKALVTTFTPAKYFEDLPPAKSPPLPSARVRDVGADPIAAPLSSRSNWSGDDPPDLPWRQPPIRATEASPLYAPAATAQSSAMPDAGQYRPAPLPARVVVESFIGAGLRAVASFFEDAPARTSAPLPQSRMGDRDQTPNASRITVTSSHLPDPLLGVKMAPQIRTSDPWSLSALVTSFVAGPWFDLAQNARTSPSVVRQKQEDQAVGARVSPVSAALPDAAALPPRPMSAPRMFEDLTRATAAAFTSAPWLDLAQSFRASLSPTRTKQEDAPVGTRLGAMSAALQDQVQTPRATPVVRMFEDLTRATVAAFVASPWFEAVAAVVRAAPRPQVTEAWALKTAAPATLATFNESTQPTGAKPPRQSAPAEPWFSATKAPLGSMPPDAAPRATVPAKRPPDGEAWALKTPVVAAPPTTLPDAQISRSATSRRPQVDEAWALRTPTTAPGALPDQAPQRASQVQRRGVDEPWSQHPPLTPSALFDGPTQPPRSRVQQVASIGAEVFRALAGSTWVEDATPSRPTRAPTRAPQPQTTDPLRPKTKDGTSFGWFDASNRPRPSWQTRYNVPEESALFRLVQLARAVYARLGRARTDVAVTGTGATSVVMARSRTGIKRG